MGVQLTSLFDQIQHIAQQPPNNFGMRAFVMRFHCQISKILFLRQQSELIFVRLKDIGSVRMFKTFLDREVKF